jgi:hypothetical protein
MNETKQTIVDVVDGTTTYYGETKLGRGTSQATWKIRRVTTAGGVTTTYYPKGTDGRITDAPTFIWDNRATLDYSLTHDIVAPTLTTVTIASNNIDTTKAKVGDVVTITIVANEATTAPVVTIAGHTATTVAGVDALHWTATYTMAIGDTSGTVTFSIAFSDIYGNIGTPVTAVTGGSGVTFDKTAPTMLSAVKDLVTQITVTLSELALASTITKANDGGFVVADTVTPATTYAVSAINPGATNDLVILTVADMTASALVGVTVTYVAGGNGTVSDLAGNVLATDATGVIIGAW